MPRCVAHPRFGVWRASTWSTGGCKRDRRAPEARKEIARGVSPGFWVQPLSQAPEGRQVDAKPAVSFPSSWMGQGPLSILTAWF